MAALSFRDMLVVIILQFLDEAKLKETRHKLEKESGLYFDMKYFEDVIVNGDLEEAEDYLTGFTKLEQNLYSNKIFFEIQKQKYLEAMDKGERAKALKILTDELKAFAHCNASLYRDLAGLLGMENFREHEELKRHPDAKSGRVIMFAVLKKLLESNPVFHEKLQFPNIPNSRLRTLIYQSLNWQRNLCKNQMERPVVTTLYKDYTCPLQTDYAPPRIGVSNPPISLKPRVGGSSPIGGPSSNQRTTAPSTSNQTSAHDQNIRRRPFSAANELMHMLRIDTPGDSENAPKRARTIGKPGEISSTTPPSSGDDLAKNGAKSLERSSSERNVTIASREGRKKRAASI